MPLPVFEWPGRHAARIERPRTSAELRRVEQVLASARLILACAAVMVTVVSDGGFHSAPIGNELLTVVYALQSAAVVLIVQYRMRAGSSLPLVLHMSDIVWAATLTTVTSGPNSPLYVLFPFCLLGAAYRWGLRETIFTGLAALAVFTSEATFASHASLLGAAVSADAGLGQILMRGTYIVMGAVVLGYVAEEEQLHHAEAGVVGRVLAQIQAETGFRAALRHVMSELLDVFEAKRLTLVAVEEDTGRTVAWEAATTAGRLTLTLEPGELTKRRRDTLRFGGGGEAWRLVRSGRRCRRTTLDRDGALLAESRCRVPDVFWTDPDVRAVVIVAVRFADHWNGRMVLDMQRPPTLAEVRLIHRLVCNVSPVMYSHYLVRRLRSRVSRTERLRVARELHDGVVQSLAGLEMHVDAMRRVRGDAIRAAGLADELAHLQKILGDEARAVREMMDAIRPFEIGRGQAVRVFDDLVTRFSRETGIVARFSTDADGAAVPPRTARELGRALQESLRNVRKHAGANRVDVAFGENRAGWQLVVENDGRPFDFIGEMTLDELEALQKGPRVIRERVRELGGDLTINSSEHGVRLEITVPRHPAAGRPHA